MTWQHCHPIIIPERVWEQEKGRGLIGHCHRVSHICRTPFKSEREISSQPRWKDNFSSPGETTFGPRVWSKHGVDVLTNVGSDVKAELWLNRADEKYYFSTRVYSLGVKPGPI